MTRSNPPEPLLAAPPAQRPPVIGRVARAIRNWWAAPQLNGWIIALSTALLALHKPWSLHTPQLFAEDGSIFVTENETLGMAAWLRPYMGYLHLIPRLVAWTASHADPAWWPALFNGAALLFAVLVLVRLASPRVVLPGKPWLALAFPLAANTGEVLFTITNVHWITAFLLVIHLIAARPATVRQRLGDLLVLVLAGLSGPFSALFLPLFVWRWWRERNRDTGSALLVIAACAAIQASWILRTSPHFDYQDQPYQLAGAAAISATRLLMWPAFGPSISARVPSLILSLVGIGVAAYFTWSVFRPGRQQTLRAIILIAGLLALAGAIYRIRADTWEPHNITEGDRYFFVPRVLLVWLVILEFWSPVGTIRVAARALCVIGIVANASTFVLPAPPDYNWAAHCDPIRRGTPAKIPTLPEGWILEYPGRPQR